MSTSGTSRSLFLAFVFFVGSVGSLHAQSVDLGADVVSRYVWRGTDFGESLSIQPAVSFSAGGFTVGSWGSFATNPSAAGVNEHDLFANYAVETSGGTISLGVTDYYFPNGGRFFNYDNDGAGAHQIEPSVSYTGPETFPVSVSASMFVYNEPDNSIYLEASYPFTVQTVDLSVTMGGTPQESAFYGTNKAGIINTGLSASKSIPITDSFSLPVSVSYILNPYQETTFLVFGVSL